MRYNIYNICSNLSTIIFDRLSKLAAAGKRFGLNGIQEPIAGKSELKDTGGIDTFCSRYRSPECLSMDQTCTPGHRRPFSEQHHP